MTHPVDLGTLFGGQYGPTRVISVIIRGYPRLLTQTATSKILGIKANVGLERQILPLPHLTMSSTDLPPPSSHASLAAPTTKQDNEAGLPGGGRRGCCRRGGCLVYHSSPE